MINRFKGCLLGLACADAVGTSVEFKPRGSFPPVKDMQGGGPFDLNPGQWTDDTSMALCLADSLLSCGEFSPRDQMDRYVRWQQEGYLSSTGTCFDTGNTVAGSLERYRRTGEPFSGSTDPHTAGNGSIMRLAPVPMFFVHDLERVAHYAGKSSRTTHGAQEAVDACKLFGVMIARALGGEPKDSILFESQDFLSDEIELAPAIAAIAWGEYRKKNEGQIRGSGYVVQSLEAALWCFWQTDGYEDAILLAANLGDDADTTAAVCGQIAGALYGIDGIPVGWLDKLAQREMIEEMAVSLYHTREHPDLL